MDDNNLKDMLKLLNTMQRISVPPLMDGTATETCKPMQDVEGSPSVKTELPQREHDNGMYLVRGAGDGGRPVDDKTEGKVKWIF